ncbi:MAG TPA: ornithine cyclodeaminase family protein [Salinisphaeraceae bacterium]|nr:ornithine cyclodeaminase family protein [Salinisphaeraceae bacterium]
MLIINEEIAQATVSRSEAFAAVEQAFAAMATGAARNFPVVREALGYADALYGFKSGFDSSAGVLGLKAGGYWPGNADQGLTNHQSSVFLFDPDTGQPSAMVAGNYLTAIRTAAACAIAIHHLARANARTLGIIGAGHQSQFQLRAAAEQRDFNRVLAWNISPHGLDRLAEIAAEIGLDFKVVERDELTQEADVIVTITSCFEPLLMADQIRPGTHLCCMGTDTIGKQEVDPALVAKARLFTDEPAQAAQLGECQHAVKAKLISEQDIVPIGAVIAGQQQGRTDNDDITLFDGTGVGLQDLAVAARAIELARKTGQGQKVEF